MTWFIFTGDLLVMLFMVLLVIWVFMVTPDDEIQRSAMIPLEDEEYLPGEEYIPGEKSPEKETGKQHG